MNWREVQRVVAESYILFRIDLLDEEAQTRLVDVMTEHRGTQGTPGEWFENFESEQSVTEGIVQWIQNEWPKRKAATPTLSPAQFAADVAQDLFIEFDF